MGRRFVERSDWLRYVTSIPEPRVLVLEDVDHQPGSGAFWDAVHVRIHLRLGCVGAITNGAVRDIPKVQPTGFYLYAGNISAARGYAHIIDMGLPVEVGGLTIHPGDLIHGDMHGFVLVPIRAVPLLPQAAVQISDIRGKIAELCGSSRFSLDQLKELLAEFDSPTNIFQSRVPPTS